MCYLMNLINFTNEASISEFIKITDFNEKDTTNLVKLPGIEMIHCTASYIPQIHRFENLKELLINNRFDNRKGIPDLSDF